MVENPQFFEALPKEEASTDRHAQVEQMLVDGFESVTTEAGFHTWLKVISRLPEYSLNNTLLIAAQKPDATHVAGYKKWQEMGRQVKKGEKAIKIYVPFRTKETDPDTGEDRMVVRRFGIGSVFDLSQTDGEPLPVGPAIGELGESNEVSKEVQTRLWRAFDGEVRFEALEMFGHKKGFWSPQEKKIAIRSVFEEDETGDIVATANPFSIGKTKTLAHELAHYIAGHTGDMNRATAEVVAESSAYVTLQRFGLDTGSYSFPYAALWGKGDVELLRTNLAEIKRISGVLIGAIEGTPPALSAEE